MTVYVFQSFELRQDKFTEAFPNIEKIVEYRNENYSHKVQLLSPIVGADYTYALISEYEGLAEMEIQNKKMFEDDEYKKLFSPFFLEHTVQGSMVTEMYRNVKRNIGKPVAKDEKDQKEDKEE